MSHGRQSNATVCAEGPKGAVDGRIAMLIGISRESNENRKKESPRPCTSRLHGGVGGSHTTVVRRRFVLANGIVQDNAT